MLSRSDPKGRILTPRRSPKVTSLLMLEVSSKSSFRLLRLCAAYQRENIVIRCYLCILTKI